MDAAPAGTLLATPLFLALLMAEFTDVIFAVDSSPPDGTVGEFEGPV